MNDIEPLWYCRVMDKAQRLLVLRNKGNPTRTFPVVHRTWIPTTRVAQPQSDPGLTSYQAPRQVLPRSSQAIGMGAYLTRISPR